MGASSTSLSDYSHKVYFGGPLFVYWREWDASSNDGSAGCLVEEGEDVNKVEPATTSAADIIGVAARLADVDIDTNFTDENAMRYYPLGFGTILWLQHDGDAGQTYSAGQIVRGSTNTVGCTEIFSYSDASQNTDCLESAVGRSFFDEEGGTGSNKYWNRIVCGL